MRRIFPRWCDIVKRRAQLVGIDLPVGAAPADYRSAIARIRDDPSSSGALITSHKVGVVQHAGDLIDGYDDDARLLGEVSCLERRDGRLRGSAVDVECSGASLNTIVPLEDLRDRDVLILGAGGAGTALAAFLQRHTGTRVHASDVSESAVARIARFGAKARIVRSPAETDALLAEMGEGAIVVNATGMGKDLPGSPITQHARFPKHAIAWELNYRGDLLFLDYARRAGVRTADGWDYFIRGWSTIMSRVLRFEITEELMRRFREIAGAERTPA